MEALFYRSIRDVARKAARLMGKMYEPRHAIGLFFEMGSCFFVVGFVDLSTAETKWTSSVEKGSSIACEDFCEALANLFPDGNFREQFVFLNEATEDSRVRRWILWDPERMKPRLVCGHVVTHEYEFTGAVH